jgi:D-aspartate ligase
LTGESLRRESGGQSDLTKSQQCHPHARALAAQSRPIVLGAIPLEWCDRSRGCGLGPIGSPVGKRAVPAVVVEGTLNALGVIRSLARGRMPIYLVDSRPQCAARWSRYCHYVRAPALDGRRLVDALVELAVRLDCNPVLILTGDHSVNCVSEHREQLEPLYRISLPSRETVRDLADKARFQKLAEREGFAVPRAVAVGDAADLTRLEELKPPLVVKPSDKRLALEGTVERAVHAATLDDARRAAAQMLPRARSLVVQEWIDGPDEELYFVLFSCNHQGRPLGLFAGRKLVCSPPAIGSTALCIAAEPEAARELTATTLQFIERTAYRGLGSLEFKRDAGTGQFIIIEPTVGRTDWQEELATLCGVNLPLQTYLAELGQELEVGPQAFASIAWRQSAGFAAPLAPGTHTVDGFFRWSDPLPGLHYYGVQAGVLRVWNRLSATAALLGGLTPYRTKA